MHARACARARPVPSANHALGLVSSTAWPHNLHTKQKNTLPPPRRFPPSVLLDFDAVFIVFFVFFSGRREGGLLRRGGRLGVPRRRGGTRSGGAFDGRSGNCRPRRVSEGALVGESSSCSVTALLRCEGRRTTTAMHYMSAPLPPLVGMRGSMVIRLWTCMISSTPPSSPALQA